MKDAAETLTDLLAVLAKGLAQREADVTELTQHRANPSNIADAAVALAKARLAGYNAAVAVVLKASVEAISDALAGLTS